VRIVRLLPATPKEVFAAWLDAEGMKNWLCPGSTKTTVVEIDAKVGGRFKIVMTDRDVAYVHTGEYREINPPKRLVFSWISSLTNSKPSLVTIQFKKKGNQTELALTHEELPNQGSANKHSGGWASILEKLVYVLRE
jgi:uncharacterized protein YndB with AHSA1/START domain